LGGQTAKFLPFSAPQAKILRIFVKSPIFLGQKSKRQAKIFKISSEFCKAIKSDFSNFVLRFGIFFALISSKKTQKRPKFNANNAKLNALTPDQ